MAAFPNPDWVRDPAPSQRGVLRQIARDFSRYAQSPTAPTWVRALRLAGRVPAPSPSTASLLTRAAPQTHLDDNAVSSSFMRQYKRKGIEPQRAREFAIANEWCRAAINKLKGRVSRSERGVVALDPSKPINPALQQRISNLIENPNPRGDSWRSFCEPWLDDLLTLGKGGWEFVPNFQGWPVAMVPYDAEFMHVIHNWDGSNPRAPRYIWGPLQNKQIGLRNDEITMILMNPTTFRDEGVSPIETLQNSIEADEYGNEFVRTMLQKYPPPGWLHLGRAANTKQVRAVSEKLRTDVLGQGGFLVTGGMDEPKFQSLWQGTSRDNELMAWSLYFAAKIATVYGLSPQDLGVTADINRANGQVQQDISAEDGFKTLLILVEEYINREIVTKFGPLEQNNLVFRFKELTLKDRLKQAKYIKDLLGDVPALTLNEGRTEMDLPPLEMGDAIYMDTPTGLVAIAGADAQAFRDQMRAERVQEAGDTTKTVADNTPTPPASEKAPAKKALIPARWQTLVPGLLADYERVRRAALSTLGRDALAYADLLLAVRTAQNPYTRGLKRADCEEAVIHALSHATYQASLTQWLYQSPQVGLFGHGESLLRSFWDNAETAVWSLPSWNMTTLQIDYLTPTALQREIRRWYGAGMPDPTDLLATVLCAAEQDIAAYKEFA